MAWTISPQFLHPIVSESLLEETWRDMAGWRQGLGGDRTCPARTKSPESAERVAPQHIIFLTPHLWAILRAMSPIFKDLHSET